MNRRDSWVWPGSSPRKPSQGTRLAWLLAAAFAAGGGLWVLCTDVLLYSITGDANLIARIETAKGWTFVSVGALLLYAVALRGAARLNRARAAIVAVVESIADGVLLLGPERTIKHGNPAAVRMLGCKRVEDLIGMGAIEFSRRFRVSYPDGAIVPPDQLVSQRVFQEGGPLQYKAVLHPDNNEQEKELVISATAAAVRVHPDEAPWLVVSVLHDITAAEHLERLRDQFFTIAAHALKTPVAIIKANVQLLTTAPPDQQARSQAAVERQCDRIDRLVQNLLVLARMRTKTLQLYPHELELRPLLERVAREMTGAFAGHEIRTEIESAPRIHGDGERLALALRDFLDGAARGARAGSPLTLRLRRSGTDAEIGIRYLALPTDPWTGDGARDYDDLGIARAVAAMILEAHGGAQREESGEVEKTLWLRLPAITDESGNA